MAAKTSVIGCCGSKSVAQQRGQVTKMRLPRIGADERGQEPRAIGPAFPPPLPISVVKDLYRSCRSLGTQPSRYQCYRTTADRQGCAVEVTRISCEWMSLALPRRAIAVRAMGGASKRTIDAVPSVHEPTGPGPGRSHRRALLVFQK